jgi:hypothetical protein
MKFTVNKSEPIFSGELIVNWSRVNTRWVSVMIGASADNGLIKNGG